MFSSRKYGKTSNKLTAEGYIRGATLLLGDASLVSPLSRFYSKVFPFQRCGNGSPARYFKTVDADHLRLIAGMSSSSSTITSLSKSSRLFAAMMSGGRLLSSFSSSFSSHGKKEAADKEQYRADAAAAQQQRRDERKCIWVPHVAGRSELARKDNVEKWNSDRDVVQHISTKNMDPLGQEVFNSRSNAGAAASFPFVHVEVEDDAPIFRDSWRAPFQQPPRHCGAVVWCELLCDNPTAIRPTASSLIGQMFWVPARPVDMTPPVAPSATEAVGPIPVPPSEGDEFLVLLDGTGELTNRHKICCLRSRSSFLRQLLLRDEQPHSTPTGGMSTGALHGNVYAEVRRTERIEDLAKVVQAAETTDAVVYFGCASEALLRERVEIIRSIGGAAICLPMPTIGGPDGICSVRAICVDTAGCLFGLLIRSSEKWDERCAAVQPCDDVLTEPPLRWYAQDA